MTKSKNSIDLEIIWKKLNSKLSAEEEEKLNAWINDSKDNQRYFENAQRYYSEGSSYNRMPADPANAFKNISQKLSNRKKNPIRTIAYVSSIAASIVLIVGLTVLLPREKNALVVGETVQAIESGSNKARLITSDGSSYDLNENKDIVLIDEGSKITSHGHILEYEQENKRGSKLCYNMLEVPRGGEFSLVLADGTRVWLNSGTTLRYPVSFTGKERVVELTGEAYFEVARNEQMPFRVKSGDQVVEVLGTSFNISSYLEDSLITTTLVEGKVSVFRTEKPDERYLLIPNYQINLNKNLNTITQRSVDVQQYTAWKDGRFYFKDQPLSEIMKILSRWYEVSVIFEDASARDIKFTGDLKRYENFEKILSLIERTEEVQFKVNGRVIEVL